MNINYSYIDSKKDRYTFDTYTEYTADNSSLYANDLYSDTQSEYDNNEWNSTWQNDIRQVSELFDRNSLYTEPRYSQARVNVNSYEDEEIDDINPIIDMYTQSYETYDTSTVEPIMSLPLTQNQYMMMKAEWNKQLERELEKVALKRQNPKIMSWSGFSDLSDEYPIVPRNSNVSNLSNNSKKSINSSKSWKSFFSKFSKKKQKKEIKFYDNLISQ